MISETFCIVKEDIARLEKIIETTKLEQDYQRLARDIQASLDYLSIALNRKDPRYTEFKSLQSRFQHLMLFAKSNSNNPKPMGSATQLESKNLETLLRTRQQLHETEETAQSITQQLSTQEDQLHQIKSNVQVIDKQLDQSNSLLSRMSRWWRS